MFLIFVALTPLSLPFVFRFYRTSAYFIAKIFCEILPTRLVPTLFYAIITAFMAGLRTDFYHLSMYWLTLTGTFGERGREGRREEGGRVGTPAALAPVHGLLPFVHVLAHLDWYVCERENKEDGQKRAD
jgi:hypothetical protein